MLHLVVGAAGGALLGAGLYSLHRRARGQPIEWRGLASATAGGLVFGVLGTAAVGSFFATAATWGQVAGLAGAGGIAGVVEQSTDNVLYGRPPGTDVPRTAALRAATGGTFGALGKGVAPMAAAAVTRGGQAVLGAVQRHPVGAAVATGGAAALGTAAAIARTPSRRATEPPGGPVPPAQPPPTAPRGNARRPGPGIVGALDAALDSP
ncbi:MAG: hypothetical protein HY722_12190 [Planctomycetes bacterium]|nr:hypothetical protein [Planctomycetota bacterium]